MRPAAYIEAVKELLVTDPIVREFDIRRERTTLTDAHLRALASLVDSSWLEFSEYVQWRPDDSIEVVTYSYHWADAAGRLIRRWDNTPHYPQLPGFPHHRHEGASGEVCEGERVSIFDVLEVISEELAKR